VAVVRPAAGGEAVNGAPEGCGYLYQGRTTLLLLNARIMAARPPGRDKPAEPMSNRRRRERARRERHD
jgi:hypothetical protein